MCCETCELSLRPVHPVSEVRVYCCSDIKVLAPILRCIRVQEHFAVSEVNRLGIQLSDHLYRASLTFADVVLEAKESRRAPVDFSSNPLACLLTCVVFL